MRDPQRRRIHRGRHDQRRQDPVRRDRQRRDHRRLHHPGRHQRQPARLRRLAAGGTSGSTIENDVIQNNIAGLSLANNPNGNPTVVRQDLFQNNNQSGPISGTAIYTDQFNAGGALANVVIDSNTFLNNQDTAVNFASSQAGSQTNVTVSNNSFTGDGNAVFLADTNGAVISGNTIGGSLGSQFVLAGGAVNVQITQNFIQNGTTNGILLLEDTADG